MFHVEYCGERSQGRELDPDNSQPIYDLEVTATEPFYSAYIGGLATIQAKMGHLERLSKDSVALGISAHVVSTT
jgi:hypothetical protein